MTCVVRKKRFLKAASDKDMLSAVVCLLPFQRKALVALLSSKFSIFYLGKHRKKEKAAELPALQVPVLRLSFPIQFGSQLAFSTSSFWPLNLSLKQKLLYRSFETC